MNASAALVIAILAASGHDARREIEPPVVPALERGPWQRLGDHVEWGNNFRVPAEAYILLHLPNRRRLGFRDATGEYVDQRTGRVISNPREINRLYDWYHPPLKSYLAAFAELVVTLGGYSTWYVYDSLLEPSAWRWPATLRGRLERDVMLQGLRFDANHMRYNSPGHPAAGALYYGILRTNGMNSLESLLGAALASLYWEVIAEMREVISINDAIQTPAGGANLAEAYHQVGLFCLRGDGRGLPRACAFLFGTPSFLHSPLTRERFAPALDVDRHGFPRDTWHRFQFHAMAGVRNGTRFGGTGLQLEAAADMELNTVRGFRTSDDNISKLVLDTTQVRLQGRAATAGGAPLVLLDVALLQADVTWLGWAWQRAFRTPAGRRVRTSVMVGLASNYEHFETDITGLWQYDRLNDFITSTGLGPQVDAAVKVGGASARLVMEGWADFAGVRARAYEAWQRRHTVDNIKFTLQRHAYYWAVGVGGQARLVLDAGPAQLGASVRVGGWRSVDLWDQHWEQLDRGKDPALHDVRSWWQGWVLVQPPGFADTVHVGMRGELLTRHGRMEDAVEHRADARGLGQFTFAF